MSSVYELFIVGKLESHELFITIDGQDGYWSQYATREDAEDEGCRLLANNEAQDFRIVRKAPKKLSRR